MRRGMALAAGGIAGAMGLAAVSFIALWPLTPRDALTPDALPYFWYVLCGAAIVGGGIGVIVAARVFKRSE